MKKIPQLDAVRGLAVLLVLVHNTDLYPSRISHLISDNGWMGVDLFFVLSGFLITGILLDTKQSEGYFRNFYARRCLRIWPLYYSVLLFMFVVVPFLRPSETHAVFESRSSPWWAFPIFLQNFLVPIPAMATGPLGVTWSLAVEEQFYLAWPLVVRFCTEAQLRKIAIAVICLSPVLRFYLSLHQVNIYSNTFCRLDGLMAGALLAILIRSVSFSPAEFLTRAWIIFLVTAPARSYGRNGVPCAMDCFLFNCSGLGFFRISRFVLAAEMATGRSDQSFFGLYGNDQLWNLFAGKGPS